MPENKFSFRGEDVPDDFEESISYSYDKLKDEMFNLKISGDFTVFYSIGAGYVEENKRFPIL